MALEQCIPEDICGDIQDRVRKMIDEVRRLAWGMRPSILDDFGLKPLRPPAPEDLYDVINERYERGSIALTSNRAPSEWPELLGDPLLASAALDRLAHRAEILIITGSSFRAQGRQRLDKGVFIEPSQP